QTFAGNLSYAGNTAQLQVENTTKGITVKHNGNNASLHGNIKALGITWEVMGFNEKASSEKADAVLNLNAVFVPLPGNYPFVGGALNWLGFYIILMMPLSYIFRKALGVQ
ncbi:MAG: hypothetical protein ABEK04_05195, partial [Candidatus Nanohalobium sp.]